jgi:hypothetical protein
VVKPAYQRRQLIFELEDSPMITMHKQIRCGACAYPPTGAIFGRPRRGKLLSQYGSLIRELQPPGGKMTKTATIASAVGQAWILMLATSRGGQPKAAAVMAVPTLIGS